MKEILSDITNDGSRMVKRLALTRNGVKVSSFISSNIRDDGGMTDEQLEMLQKTDYSYLCSSVISEQTNWLDVSITVFNKVALYRPTIQILNQFSENSKILIMAGPNIVKTFDIGGITGVKELDFLENDELVSNPGNSEGSDDSKYFMSSGYKAFIDKDGLASPIILNPFSVNAPLTVTANIVGNENSTASGVFKMNVVAFNE